MKALINSKTSNQAQLSTSTPYGQSQPLRIEGSKYLQLITVKTQGNALWFVNNKSLEQQILTYLARYASIYQVRLYAFVLMGNHYHLLAKFKMRNQAQFMQQLNARIAELVRTLVKDHPGGSVLKHHYSAQYIPLDADILKYFLYCAGQAVSSGLAQSVKAYPGYNSYQSAVRRESCTYRWIDRAGYNRAKRGSLEVVEEDYAIYYELKYELLPGLEKLTPEAYHQELTQDLRVYLKECLRVNAERGVKYPNISKLYEVKPGAQPRTTKTSHRNSYRPLVLCACASTKNRVLEWYFEIFYEYKAAIASFITGRMNVSFPEGTYRPFSLA